VIALKRKAFTLIEVLVVITIIGILIAFLAPRLLNFQDKGRETAVKAVMHSLELSIESYNMENQTYPVAKNAGVKSLCENYLMVGGYISAVPQNPFTGVEYTDADLAGKIVYNYDDATGKYTIVGYRRNGISKLLELSNQ
jgi:type II secretion system protein G